MASEWLHLTEVFTSHCQKRRILADALHCCVVEVIGCTVFLSDELIWTDHLQFYCFIYLSWIFDKVAICTFLSFFRIFIYFVCLNSLFLVWKAHPYCRPKFAFFYNVYMSCWLILFIQVLVHNHFDWIEIIDDFFQMWLL